MLWYDGTFSTYYTVVMNKMILQTQSRGINIYGNILGYLFFILNTISIGLSIRTLLGLTKLDTHTMKHLFFNILFFPGFAFMWVYIYPKFKLAVLKIKHIKLSISILLLMVVSIMMGLLSWNEYKKSQPAHTADRLRSGWCRRYAINEYSTKYV